MRSKSKSGSKNLVFHVIFTVMLLFFIVLVVYLAGKSDSKSLADISYERTAPFTEGWHTADGTQLDEQTIRKINSIADDSEISIFNTLPVELPNADELYFRAKNVYFTVLIDGEEMFSPKLADSIFYPDSTGTRWTCIDITPEQLGKEIEIRITAAYPKARCGIEYFRIGSSGGIVLNILEEKLVSIITCILLMFVGIFLVIADIPINMRSQKNHELLYLGLFSSCVSVWCFTELHILEIFYDNSRLALMVSVYSLMLIPFALLLYLNESVGFQYKATLPITCGCCIIGFVLRLTLHFLNISDIHETLAITHVSIVIAAALLVYCIIKTNLQKAKKQGVNFYMILRIVGICIVALAAMIDIIRYYFGATSDNALFVRIGMLIFTICYGSSGLENTINAVKMGAQAEFVSNLAYHDGLTGIGNRTAFEEKLAELDKNREVSMPVGIVMFDVNDLKYINDNLGHPLGDKMIKKAAEIVSSSFGSDNAECFRIGGDEFAVIMQGEFISDRFDRSYREFRLQVERHNDTPDNEFRVSIAHGFFIYTADCGVEKITDAYKAADERMYANKREMKAHQIPPAEYYAQKGIKAKA